MNVGRRYLLSVVVLVALGVLAYSVADENLTPFLISLPVLACAWLLNGGSRPTPMPRWLINALLAAATVHMALSWSESVADAVSVLSRYLVWLQLIKMFERHEPRDQAQVIGMSMMLVVGSCLTAVTPELGAVLLVYLPALMWTSMMFQVWAEHVRTHAQEGEPPAMAPASGRGVLARLLGMGAGPAPLALPAPTLARAARRDLRAIGLLAGLGIVAISIGVYVAMPRELGEQMFGRWQGAMAQPTTGFRDHVQLGAQGLLSDSPRPMLSVEIEGPEGVETGSRPFRLRGAVLDRYDPVKGMWNRSAESAAGNRTRQSPTQLRRAPSNDPGPYYRTRVTVLEGGTDELFSLWRPLEVELVAQGERVQTYTFNEYDGVIRVPFSSRSITYSVLSAPRSESPAGPLIRPERIVHAPFPVALVAPEPTVGPRVQPPRSVVEGPIGALARRVLAESRVSVSADDPDARRIAAAALTRWLSKTFVYTREMVAPSEGQDPTEMFLLDPVKGRRGHCEYFASGLAAMCISVGIPARVVTGYIVSEYNHGTRAFVVRESDAHAWVEVETRPGRWEEFDPSPAIGLVPGGEARGLVASGYRRLIDALELAWVRGIVSFDRRQQEGTLEVAARLNPIAGLRRLNTWLTGVLTKDLEHASAEPSESRVLQRFVAYVLVSVTLVVVLGYALVMRGLAMLRRLRAATDPHGAPDGGLENDPLGPALRACIGRLMKALERAGSGKPAWVPIGAHVRAMQDEQPALARAAMGVVDVYYRCRFSGQPVTREALATARGALQEAEALAPARRGAIERGA